MHHPHPTDFHSAIYQCADCQIEHNGDRRAMPIGWDTVTDPRTGRIVLRCPDCLEHIEQDWQGSIDQAGPLTCHVAGACGWEQGVAAAAYRGAVA